MNYRTETFIEYIRKSKLHPVMGWFLNIGYLGIIILIIISTYYNGGRHYWGVPFFLILALIQKSFLYSTMYTIYGYGRKAYEQLGEEKKQILVNVEIYTREFDMFSQSRLFPVDISKTNYELEVADLILTNQSIILLGRVKSNPMGATAPVELTNSNGLTKIAKAQINSWYEINNYIEIEINDPRYKKPIRLDFKSEQERIKQWLTEVMNDKHKPIVNVQSRRSILH